MTSALDMQSIAFNVARPISPGPAPTKYTLPLIYFNIILKSKWIAKEFQRSTPLEIPYVACFSLKLMPNFLLLKFLTGSKFKCQTNVKVQMSSRHCRDFVI